MGTLGQIKEELKFEIIGVALIALGVIGLLSIVVPSSGLVSVFIDRVLKGIAGEGRFLFPVLLIMVGARLVLKRRLNTTVSIRMYGALLLFILLLTFCHLIIPVDDSFKAGLAGDGGGLLGAVFSYVLRKSFGIAGTYIILIAAGIIALLLLTNLSLATIARKFTSALWSGLKSCLQRLDNFFFIKVEEDKNAPAVTPVIIDNSEEPFPTGAPTTGQKNHRDHEEHFSTGTENANNKEIVNPDNPETDNVNKTKDDGELEILIDNNSNGEKGAYQLPPLTLLSRPLKAKNIRLSKDINENIRILEETLESFGVKAKVMQVSRGPAITRYEIQPPAGVKVSRIVSLADDIALSMAAPDVRIEAPIPGKAAVGIEVPNKEISTVHIRDLLETQEFRQAKSKLTVVLGKDIAGNPIVADLAKMPHLLIAGATGSGKSVCLNTLIASILFKATPDEVKFLMIDPKMVELATYNGIPHLVSPVVTDPQKSGNILTLGCPGDGTPLLFICVCWRSRYHPV